MRSDADQRGAGADERQAPLAGVSPWVSGLGIVLLAPILLAVGFFGVRALLWTDVTAPRVDAAALRASAEASSVAASGGMAEVPSVCGLRADEALVLLQTAGFKVAFEATGAPVSAAASRTVKAQLPAAGVVRAMDTTITLAAPALLATTGPAVAAAPQHKPGSGFIICIDPGHQAHANAKLEPIGPKSKILKPRMTGGLSGVASGLPEYELALQLATNLKKRLEAAGARVVMTRVTNDVDLTNIQRAAVANRYKADLFVRVHANASTDASASGVAVVYPAKTSWTRKTWARSKRAAVAIEEAVARSAGAANDGITSAATFAGFNWATMPSVMVEAGYLSNPVEDRLLASPSYQDKVARGMSEGILAYLARAGQ